MFIPGDFVCGSIKCDKNDKHYFHVACQDLLIENNDKLIPYLKNEIEILKKE